MELLMTLLVESFVLMLILALLLEQKHVSIMRRKVRAI